MILMLYGEDTYRSKRKLGEIRAKFLRDIDSTGLNLAELEGNADIGAVKAAIGAAPFLAAKRMVILKNALSKLKKKDKRDAELAEVFSSVPDETILVVVEDASSEKIGKLASFGARDPKFYPEFVPLAAAKLSAWIQEEASDRGFSFEPAALKAYLLHTPPDLWKISGDLDKFAAYLGKDGKVLGIEALHELAELKTEAGLFEFLDAIGTRRAGVASRLFERLLIDGESEVALLTRIQSHVRALLVSADKSGHGSVSKDELARELGIHPYAASKAMMQARYFTVEELKRLYACAIESDERLKTGGWAKPRMAIDLFLLQLERP